jgi:hypothetical protein
VTKPANPRTTLLVHLAEDLKAAIEMRDLETAQVAHEAIGRLLGMITAPVPVVELSVVRAAKVG